MDLWDLTKLLFRRWYLALPLLLLSAGMVFLVAQRVSPDYSAKGYLQLIPAPSVGQPEDPRAAPRPTNPWLDLGYEALGNAAALPFSDRRQLDRLVGQGLSESVTVLVNENTGMFEIEAIGVTPRQATATVREVIRKLDEDVAARQRQYSVLPQDTITTLVIDDGGSAEPVTSKMKRALIVVTAISLLTTAGVTIGADALLRRRARRRILRAQSSPDAEPQPLAAPQASAQPSVAAQPQPQPQPPAPARPLVVAQPQPQPPAQPHAPAQPQAQPPAKPLVAVAEPEQDAGPAVRMPVARVPGLATVPTNGTTRPQRGEPVRAGRIFTSASLRTAEETQVVPPANGEPTQVVPRGNGEPTRVLSIAAAEEPPVVADRPPTRTEDRAEDPVEDATIVLPLSGSGRRTSFKSWR